MKRTIFFTVCSLLISVFSFGQTSTEVFETEVHNSPIFTDNGVVFNILTYAGGFDIQANYPGTGWNGTATDNRYIDNSGAGNVVEGASFGIKTTSNLFKVQRFWMFLSNNSLNQTVTGSLTITGKLNGSTLFTQTKTTGFATSLGSTNGYTLIDFTNLNGQNYTNIAIDELVITLGGNYTYAGLDAFTWIKDSNMVLATGEAKVPNNKLNVYPNPTNGAFSIKTEENISAEIYNMEGQIVKSLDLKKGINEENISELPNGVYLIKTLSESYKIIKR